MLRGRHFGWRIILGSVPITRPMYGMVRHGSFSEDVISVWNRSASNTEGIEKIRESVKRLLKIPSFVQASQAK